MPSFDLYSKRKELVHRDSSDVFRYDVFPEALKHQIIYIIEEALGEDIPPTHYVKDVFEYADRTLRKEYGVASLASDSRSSKKAVISFFLREETVDRSLDVVQVMFKIISFVEPRGDFRQRTRNRELSPEMAIAELNRRFREHGVGFQYESGEIIRVDSEFIHSEVLKPVLEMLKGPHFQGANDEFMSAHEHYRHGQHKECLADCLKSFESTIKSICVIRGWDFKPTDTARNLIGICFEKELVPEYLNSQFTSLRSTLESGVPTLRNRNGGHGQGAVPVQVPEYLARYSLNLTAATILFLVDAASISKE